jgi:hypothetical protein
MSSDLGAQELLNGSRLLFAGKSGRRIFPRLLRCLASLERELFLLDVGLVHEVEGS